MMSPNALRIKFEAVFPSLVSIKEGVTSILSSYCEENGFALVSRIKTIDSVVGKIETGRFKTFNDLDDLVGFMLIVPTLNHISSAEEYLMNSFETVTIKRRGGAFKAPDKFRFDSTRLIARLKNQDETNPRSVGYNLCFEIQIRTAFEYAWSIATHDLTYKTDNLSWKRLRLTSQIKATVEQLDMLISGFESINDHITESKDQQLSIQIALTDFFNQKFETGEIPDVIKPQNMNRFSESIIKLLLHSEKISKKDYRKTRRGMLKLLDKILNKFKSTSYPLSITLYQSIMGELVNLEPNIFESSKQTFFITSDAITLYPNLRFIENKFKIKEEE